MFTKKERCIFRYFDGQKKRGMDPLEADIAMESSKFDWEANVLGMQLGEGPAAIATIAEIRRIFGLKEYDAETEAGLTSSEVLDVLADFGAWKETVKNFFVPPQTSPQSTVDNPPTIENGTDSTSTSQDKSTEIH